VANHCQIFSSIGTTVRRRLCACVCIYVCAYNPFAFDVSTDRNFPSFLVLFSTDSLFFFLVICYVKILKKRRRRPLLSLGTISPREDAVFVVCLRSSTATNANLNQPNDSWE